MNQRPGIIGESDAREFAIMVDGRRWNEVECKARKLLLARPNVGVLYKLLSVALARQGKTALPEMRRAALMLPEDAEAQVNLAATLLAVGETQEALRSFSRALKITPNDGATLTKAADAYNGAGQPRDAIPLYRRALSRDSGSPRAHNNLGNAFFKLGQFAEASECYRAALRIDPHDAKLHSNLGNSLRQQGQLPASLESCHRASILDPGLPEAHNNLGLALAGLGEFEQSLQSYRRALALEPDYLDALNNQGNALRDLGARDAALLAYARAVEVDPSRAESHCNLGNILFELQRIDEAAASYREALRHDVGHAAAHVSLAMALRLQGRPDDAQASCHAALDRSPRCVEALALLGELHADRGQFDEAEAFFAQALAFDPNFPFAYFNIAMHRKMTTADSAWLKGAEALVAKRLPLRHEISLRYALGKYHDDLKEYARAFDSYQQAKDLAKRGGLRYDADGLTRHADGIIERFSSVSAAARRDGNASARPVFIVGMPRSGTSLTEQILASHPEVFGAGEISFWDEAYRSYEAADLRGVGAAELIPAIAEKYLERMAALSSGALRVVNKMPPNFMNLGLIHAAFPNAKIIHMRRHPIDTCLSIYFQYFQNSHPYANDLGDLAHYYGNYLRVMDHWRRTLPAAALLDIPYESLVADQEGWSRRAVDFVGLPWNDRCLDFHRTDRIVITASKWQVRQKIHSASAGRWKNYRDHMAALLPLIEQSGYS